jgi:hypothetical protein
MTQPYTPYKEFTISQISQIPSNTDSASTYTEDFHCVT